jgi:hypothetical protein
LTSPTRCPTLTPAEIVDFGDVRGDVRGDVHGDVHGALTRLAARNTVGRVVVRCWLYDQRMAYDAVLARRIRELLLDEPDVDERQMFGGLAFMVGQHMAVAASGQGGMFVRVDPATTDALIATTTALPMEMGGREMRGWIRVDVAEVRTKRQLGKWVELGTSYTRSLPAKTTSPMRRRPPT